ncbi:MAG: hypothetical protein CO187_04505, partial [Zetaproteobacteria bacterium CG_4_9_14_3_um_filter_53_7]
MPIHPVKRALERDVIPYIVSGRNLRKQWFYQLHYVFGYTTDIVASFAAVGIGAPIFDIINADAKPEKIQSALLQVPSSLFVPVVLIFIAWVVLRVIFSKEDGQKRAVLAKSCLKSLDVAEAKLHKVLSQPNPMPDLIELLEKQIRQPADRALVEGAWPWLPFAPDCDDEISNMLDKLCQRYESDWAPVDTNGIDLQG